MNANVFITKDYGNKRDRTDGENKAKQSQFQNPTPRQREEKEGVKNECRFLEPYIGDRKVYWGTGPFSKAISRWGKCPRTRRNGNF